MVSSLKVAAHPVAGPQPAPPGAFLVFLVRATSTVCEGTDAGDLLGVGEPAPLLPEDAGLLLPGGPVKDAAEHNAGAGAA
jgi:hypothetical protein